MVTPYQGLHDDGVIQGHYSPAGLQERAEQPADRRRRVHRLPRRDQARADRGTGGGGGGAGAPGGTGAGRPRAATRSRARRRAENAAAGRRRRPAAPSKPVQIGGKLVQPGKLGFGGLGSPTTLPASLIAVLVALGIAAAAAGATYVRNRVIARRAA